VGEKIFRVVVVILLAAILGLQTFQFISAQQKAGVASRIYAEYINNAYLSTETDRIAEQQLLAEETQIRLLSMLLGHSGEVDPLLVEDIVIEGVSADATQASRDATEEAISHTPPYETTLSAEAISFNSVDGIQPEARIPSGTKVRVLEFQTSTRGTRALIETMEGLVVQGWISAGLVR